MRRPNIIFLHLDQLNAQAIGAYGCPHVSTPNMDRLVRRGVSFMQSACTNPVCMPARTSWYTGLMSEEHGQISNGNEWAIDPSLPDLGPYLREAGYDCFYVGKWHITKPLAKSFDVLHYGHPHGELGDGVVSRISEAFLHNHRPDKPYFLNIGLLNPHDICYWTFNPCGPGKFQFGAEIEDRLPPLPPNFHAGHDSSAGQGPSSDWGARARSRAPVKSTRKGWSQRDWQFYIYTYYRHVEMVDEEVGRILSAYEDGRHADDTILIFSSDHGESIGQHGHFTKGVLWDASVMVPLIAVDPSVPEPRRDTTHMVSGIDVTATITDYANVDPLPKTHGRSLRPLIQGESPDWRPYAAATTMKGRQRMIRTPEFKLIHVRGSEDYLLYDFVHDPWEMNDVSADGRFQTTLAQMKTYMDENEATYDYAPKVRRLLEGKTPHAGARRKAKRRKQPSPARGR